MLWHLDSIAIHEYIIILGIFEKIKILIFLLNKSNYEPNLDKFLPLSTAPHPPRVVWGGQKEPLRGVACVLKGVEDLTFLLRFEPVNP